MAIVHYLSDVFADQMSPRHLAKECHLMINLGIISALGRQSLYGSSLSYSGSARPQQTRMGFDFSYSLNEQPTATIRPSKMPSAKCGQEGTHFLMLCAD